MKMKKIMFLISLLSLIPVVLGLQSTINIYGGDSSQLIHVDNCSRINVSVTGILRIDYGEYWFSNCSKRFTNLWNCTCKNNTFNLVINTLPNTINTYNVTTNIFSPQGTCNHNTTYYCDKDKDDYYSKIVSGICNSKDCIPKGCRTTSGNDCNDFNKSIHPGAVELCNGKDDDCDGKIDEGCLSAEKACNNIKIGSRYDYKSLWTCVIFDWKNNENKLFPHDCDVKYINRSPVCVANDRAD